jgi:CBS domain containing-hemolysin-like protein
LSGSAIYFSVAGAALLFVFDLILSVALGAGGALSRVALHRLAVENENALGFLDRFRKSYSSHRLAAIILRQLSLLGATLLLAVAGQGAGWGQPAAIGVALGALIGVLLVEALLARALAVWNPRLALRVTAPFVRGARLLLYPVVAPLSALLVRIGERQQLSEEEREEEQEEEVEALIEVGEREGLLEAEEGEMMRGIVDLDEKLVREIMTPRTDIVALPAETPLPEARRVVLEAGHSRLPVHHGSIDNVVGVLHSRDLLQAWEDGNERQTIGHYLRPATFVPETLSAAELLSGMRQKTQIAVVVDEYGGTAGIVTLEDLLEEIVGEIRDEHDEEEELVRQKNESTWVINAVAHVDELESLFGVEFEERDFDTVGGLVVSTFGRVPYEGESVVVQGLRIEVIQADQRRVHKVRIRRADLSGDIASGS